MSHLHITLSSSLPLTTIEIFQTVQNFVTEKKIGEVMWMNEEGDVLQMGIVMKKETASENIEQIKEHLGEMGITEVGFVMPLRSTFDEKWVKENYKMGFLD